MTVATLLLIRKAWKHRDSLYAYDTSGALLTLIALLFLYMGFATDQQWLSVAFSTTTVIYWLLIAILKFRKR